jgi:hypothetical protein
VIVPSESQSQPMSLAAILRLGWSRLVENRALTALGAVGIFLGLFCLSVMALRHGAPIPPEGDLQKPASFDIAVGIYLLTLGLLLPSAGFSERGRRRWVRWSIVAFGYAYIIENVQTFRGLDPRFSRVGGPVDQILGLIFLFAALNTLVLFVIMALRFFRRNRPDRDSPLILAIKYGAVSSLGAFAAGIWMSAAQGRHTGVGGNILPLHALGFHGLQAVPLVALLLHWSGAGERETKEWVHVTGIAWVTACAAVAWQTAAGRSIVDVSPAILVTAFVLAVWTGIAVLAFWRWARVVRPRESPGTSRTPTAHN